MTAPSEYLDFEEWADTGRTKVWDVLSRSGGDRLARIKWYGPWRQYTFHPEPGTVWNPGCLAVVAEFIGEQMAARRERRCPRCDSNDPQLHPAVQAGGEVQPCPDPFHFGVLYCCSCGQRELVGPLGDAGLPRCCERVMLWRRPATAAERESLLAVSS